MSSSSSTYLNKFFFLSLFFLPFHLFILFFLFYNFSSESQFFAGKNQKKQTTERTKTIFMPFITKKKKKKSRNVERFPTKWGLEKMVGERRKKKIDKQTTNKQTNKQPGEKKIRRINFYFLLSSKSFPFEN